MLGMKLTGDWKKSGLVLEDLAQNLTPEFKKQMDKDADLILRTLQNHIDLQDLPWEPLSERTIALKGGNKTIYVETGWLRKNLSVRRLKSSKLYRLFIGASPWKTHKPSGVKFSDLMTWLEYGTDKIPPRPLIRPTHEEVEPIIKRRWIQLLRSMIYRKGRGYRRPLSSKWKLRGVRR